MKFKTILIVLIALIYVSCNHKEESEHSSHEQKNSGGHDHEGVKIQFTTYSSEFELFAEADPFVIGEVSHILAHFSVLPSFKPITEGKINLRLLVKEEESRHSLNSPTRKGIYLFKIKPMKPGKAKLIFEIESDTGTFEVIVPGLEVFSDEHDAIHHAEDDEISVDNSIVFTKEQSWKLDFATELPLIEAFGEVIKTTALIEPAQGDEIIITAKTNGTIIFAASNVLEGKAVSKGQELFFVSGKGLADNDFTVKFVGAKNNYEKAKADYDRVKELVKEKIVSEKELLNAKIQYDNAKAIYDNLNENFNSSGQKVSSPMNGFVKQLYVENGQYIETGQAIVSILQNNTLWLSADVQQKYSSVLGSIHSANIRTLYNNQTYTLEQLDGEILSYGRSANNNNFLIPITLQIKNTKGLVPGSFVELFLKTISNTKALTIPNSAIMEEQGSFFVFVQITPELFEKRGIKPDITDGLRTEIMKGIAHNERIVTLGAIHIKLAMATGSLDAHSGHVH